MTILRRYVLRELAIPFFISLCLFTFIFLVGNLVKLADLLVNKGVSLFDILRILILLAPRLLGFVLPTSVLTAILLTFGGFAQHNEIIAIKTAGINLWKVVSPVVLAAFFVSFIALVMNDQIQPRISFVYRQAVRDLLIKKPAAYLEAGKLIRDFKDFIILAQKVDGNQLEGITIYQTQEGKPTRTIIAERGEIVSSMNDKTLMMRLYNGTSDEPNPDNPSVLYKMDFKTFMLPPIRLGPESDVLKKKTKDMTLDELLNELRLIARQPADVDPWRRVLEIKSEIHKKISFSMASFVFALMGLPLAIVTRRGEAVVSFGLAMAVVTVYYVFFVWANTMGVRGILPPFIALWIPNLLMGGVGVFLFRRVLAV